MNEKTDSVLSDEDKLSDISADLLEFDRYEAFLERLFAQPPGEWLSLASACEGVDDIMQRVNELASRYDTGPQVMWANYPAELNRRGYCIIVFFAEGPDWRSVAVYNKNRYLRGRSGNAHSSESGSRQPA